jgi:hypothetical protein
MKSKAYFKEEQTYPFWIVISIGMVLLLSIFFLSNSAELPGKKVIISSLIISLTLLLFLLISLKLKVDESEIIVRFRPFINREKKIRWEELKSARLRRSSPMLEFGGWGYRMRFNKRAYTLYGSWGLDLEFKNGKKLFIGVQKHDHLHLFLEERIYSKYPELESWKRNDKD